MSLDKPLTLRAVLFAYRFPGYNSGMKERYDVLVIGGGTAGMNAAKKAAASGASVALAEGGKAGGT